MLVEMMETDRLTMVYDKDQNLEVMVEDMEPEDLTNMEQEGCTTPPRSQVVEPMDLVSQTDQKLTTVVEDMELDRLVNQDESYLVVEMMGDQVKTIIVDGNLTSQPETKVVEVMELNKMENQDET